MRERGQGAFVLLASVLAASPAQAQKKVLDGQHRNLRHTIRTFFVVGTDLSTVIARCVTERQRGGGCLVGEALP